MSTYFNGLDAQLALFESYGSLCRAISDKYAAVTATTIAGDTSLGRFPNPFTIPSFGAGVNAAYLSGCWLNNQIAATCMACLEIPLGTLTVSGNSFAAGSTMPTRTIAGSSIQLASVYPVLAVTTALGGATTPTVTITYTDQDGITNQTATITLPSNPAINSVFNLNTHLTSGDTGIRAVTNMSISAGTSGAIKCMGLVPLTFGSSAINNVTGMTVEPQCSPLPMTPLLGGDIIAFYASTASATDLHAFICLTPSD